jgi:hypothetical protein
MSRLPELFFSEIFRTLARSEVLSVPGTLAFIIEQLQPEEVLEMA